MIEKLKKIHERLLECNLSASVRVSFLEDDLRGFNAIGCFLITSDRFDNIDELEKTVSNCIKNLKCKIQIINTGMLTIIPV